ncbi:lipase member H-A-like isoform X1 [Planococcus citri]|uniref:lipase member H-A-like isoform X1 n=1 Tax=Planococcus citri TaxID=170843 RepID=UPI0031F9A7D2
MKMNSLLLFPSTLCLSLIVNTYGYVYGPVVDRKILYDEQYTTFITCQTAATVIRTALKLNIPLESFEIPPRPIMDEDVTYYLFTRKNSNTPDILRSSDSAGKIKSSNINFKKETVFYIHGYNQTIYNGVSNFTKFLLPKKDVNVIIVNWDSYATFNLEYSRSITVPRLGEIVGRFVKNLINAGANPKNIHLIGFSAGGEAVGLAGKTINPRVGRISAFDPEGSCFNFAPSTQRISKTDADFVQIVHCSVGIRALPPYIMGDVTFIMNGGVLQPNCVNETSIMDLGDCSHAQCETFLYETLTFKGNKSLVGTKCGSFLNYDLNQCDCQDRVQLTYDIPTSLEGLYFINTVSNKPCGDQKKV